MKAFVVTVYTRRCEVPEDGLSSVGEGVQLDGSAAHINGSHKPNLEPVIQFRPKLVLIKAVE
jgi:hypothetical protein